MTDIESKSKSKSKSIVIVENDDKFDFKFLRDKEFRVNVKVSAKVSSQGKSESQDDKTLNLSPPQKYFSYPNGCLSEQAERITLNEYNRSGYMKMIREETKVAHEKWMKSWNLQTSIDLYRQQCKFLKMIPIFEEKDYAEINPFPEFTMYDIGTLVFGQGGTRQWQPYQPYITKTIIQLGDVTVYDIGHHRYRGDWKTVEGKGYYLPMSGYSYQAESIDKILRSHLEYDKYNPKLAMMVYWIKDLLGAKLYLACLEYDQKSGHENARRDWSWFSREEMQDIRILCDTIFNETMTWITKNVPQFSFSWNRCLEQKY